MNATPSRHPVLNQLLEQGQSVWYDNLSRSVLRSGELKTLVEQGVRGLTSNPTIFKKAIADSSDYDSDILELSRKGLGAEQICEELMIGDVQEAADLLSGVFQESRGTDGFASLEVSPFLASDTAGTIEAATRLWSKLDRPNVMIKIPATREGIPAIQSCLTSGININVTLIFSVNFYEQVANAYVSALRERKAKGADVQNLRSVASFFVSRVDSAVEQALKNLAGETVVTPETIERLFGTVGIANSVRAYQKFRSIFSSSEFKQLEQSGAVVQRPLWASTGVKSDKLSPLLYVERLVASDTVNTLPPHTLEILMNSQPTIQSIEERVPEIEMAPLGVLSETGIDLEGELEHLRIAGVDAFSGSYQELLAAIEEKKSRL